MVDQMLRVVRSEKATSGRVLSQISVLTYIPAHDPIVKIYPLRGLYLCLWGYSMWCCDGLT